MSTVFVVVITRFIPYIDNLYLFAFFSLFAFKDLLILLNFSKNYCFVSLILYCLLLSVFILIYLVPPPTSLGLLCSHLSWFLSWELRLLILEFFSFLTCAFSTKNFPFSNLAMFHRFQYALFLFSFSLIYFSIEILSLTHSIIFNFQVFRDFPVIFLSWISGLISLWS